MIQIGQFGLGCICVAGVWECECKTAMPAASSEVASSSGLTFSPFEHSHFLLRAVACCSEECPVVTWIPSCWTLVTFSYC